MSLGSMCESMRVEMDGEGSEEMEWGRVTDVAELGGREWRQAEQASSGQCRQSRQGRQGRQDRQSVLLLFTA